VLAKEWKEEPFDPALTGPSLAHENEAVEEAAQDSSSVEMAVKYGT
jgi:hypothetical protein